MPHRYSDAAQAKLSRLPAQTPPGDHRTIQCWFKPLNDKLAALGGDRQTKIADFRYSRWLWEETPRTYQTELPEISVMYEYEDFNQWAEEKKFDETEAYAYTHNGVVTSVGLNDLIIRMGYRKTVIHKSSTVY